MVAIRYINTNEEEFLRMREPSQLYRFLPLEFALQVLEEQAFRFANPLEWKDPFEKRFLEAKYAVGRQERNLPLKNRIVCMCLSRTYSCAAFWNVYAHNDIGVGFTLNKRALLKMLRAAEGYQPFIGSVNYMETRDIVSFPARNKAVIRRIFDRHAGDTFDTQMKLMLMKRTAFQYESEERIILLKEKESTAHGEKISFASIPLITRITLDPRLPGRTAEMLKNHFKSRYGIRVVKSQIYGDFTPQIIKLAETD